MFDKIDLILDKVRNVSAKIQNVSKFLSYLAKVVDHISSSFANLPRFSAPKPSETESQSQAENQ
tara:strand:- start:234 stop:425 length:192 start_codon:yes stop_codon:yes gene_type:complete